MKKRQNTAVKPTIDARNIRVPSLAPNPIASDVNKHFQEALGLLKPLWNTPEFHNFMGELNRNTKQFRNIPVKNALDAVSKIVIGNSHIEYYFACAIYSTALNRTATNVLGARGFWMDIDCGVEKDSAKKGYLTKDIAQKELESFCDNYHLPKPTHIVDSGNGLHVYWILDDIIDCVEWQKIAKKLKQLTVAYKLLVDGSRTADITSVMRILGTMNNKGAIPKLVKLIKENPVLIKAETMLQSIENAHSKLNVNKPTNIVPLSTGNRASSVSNRPDIAKLESALKVLNPDCDEETWKLNRIAPLANIAADFPELFDKLKELAIKWSSGELVGIPSVAWSTPGNNNRLTGEEAFEKEWNRFTNSNYLGKRASLGTLYHDAKEAGWKPAIEKFTIVDNGLDETESIKYLPALQTLQRQFMLLNVSGKIYVFDNDRLQISIDGQSAQKLELSTQHDAKLFIDRVLARTHPNIDASKVYKEFIKSPLTTCYVGIDFHPKGVNKNYLNLWVDPYRKAKKGQCEKIISFLLNVICDGDEVAYNYLFSYIAHALQRPEEKPGVMLILLGSQGIGKGTLGRIFQKIWSSTYLQICNIDHVVGNFNAALERSFIVFMDEALFSGDRRSSEALKSLVTEPFIQINEKYQPARQTQSFHRFIAATNATHFKNTEHDDRRDFVLKVSERYKNDHQYWTDLAHEMDNGGIEALMYLLEQTDLSGFNVRAKPSTQGLLEQKLMSLGVIESWWYECLDSGRFYLDSQYSLNYTESDDSENWSDFINTLNAIDSIMKFHAGKIYKKPTPASVIKAFTTICPSAKKHQIQINNERHRGLALPPLQVAREEFEAYIGGSLPWSDVNA